MVDFKKLSASHERQLVIEPREIFNRLPKPPSIDDLHSSQAEALSEWYASKTQKDVVIKLNTGGGKTLVGLLIALSSAWELQRGALYLVDSKQLVGQVCEQARSLGISVSEYAGPASITADFRNGKTILVAHYQALFNGRSSFGLNSSSEPEDVSVIIIDDAHSSFDTVRNSFTVEVNADDDLDLFRDIASLFRTSFASIDRETTFDEFISGTRSIGEDVLEVPFWSWLDNYRGVAQLISSRVSSQNDKNPTSQSIRFSWPLIKNDLKYCLATLSRTTFSITPLLPFMDKFPTFNNAPRRVYMSATFADEGAIIRSFGCRKSDLKVISPKTLAGIGRRMILQIGSKDAFHAVLIKRMQSLAQRGFGVVVLEPSFSAADQWGALGVEVVRPSEVEATIAALRGCALKKPVVFANRYNGLDLPGDACRLLVMSGIPKAMSDYQKLLSKTLARSRTYARSIAQSIEQAIGRGTRGSGDYCVVVLVGHDLCEWVKDERHALYMTPSTRAQIACGEDIMAEIKTPMDFDSVINQGIDGDPDFAAYLADFVADNIPKFSKDDSNDLEELASHELKAINAWRQGKEGRCIEILEEFASLKVDDDSAKGLALQIAAQAAYSAGSHEQARQLQERAHGLNSALVKAAVPTSVSVASMQAKLIVRKIAREEDLGRNILSEFDKETASLTNSRKAVDFEMGLEALGAFLGAKSERCDKKGDGPDVLWVFEEENVGIMLEAKNEKKADNCFSKKEHGQLLVSREWFKKYYPGMEGFPVSVHPNDLADKNASADSALVLIPSKLSELQKEVRLLITTLSSLSRNETARLARCDAFLDEKNLRGRKLIDSKTKRFVSEKRIVDN
ncbi:DEAD/DEAH box helicase [Slackia exigua]|uniref:DEAD/DEAH box helicase n=1 Tax=Slackia exigua TaxID=84109 RepID=UPI002005CA2F|nr:DEAD/DEAH box helicase family protein [Slackia exigua]MCK6139748.1 DEAD/DEAH box helicase family protein [Slackia exigua]